MPPASSVSQWRRLVNLLVERYLVAGTWYLVDPGAGDEESHLPGTSNQVPATAIRIVYTPPVMAPQLVIDATPAQTAAIHAIVELLTRLKTEYAFVGRVAISAWLGEPVGEASIDVLAAINPESSRQVPMMAGHRGFGVEREAIEATEELDLIPLEYPAGGVRIHVLMATNALYGRMFGAAVDAAVDDGTVRVVGSEDLGLLLTVAQNDTALAQFGRLRERAGEGFDLPRFNRKLISIGLSHLTVPA
ncbi:MAG: hypothetical protein ACYC7A_14040 [Thermoanaerobaculia bacterium]